MKRYDYLKTMEALLSEEDKERLQSIYAPVPVAVPLEDARRYVCIMADGEIRSYGYVNHSAENPGGEPAYLSSRDCGLSFRLHRDTGVMKSSLLIPEAGRYIGINRDTAKGTYVFLSGIGPDDPSPRMVKVCDEPLRDMFLPVMSAFSNRIWFTAQRPAAGEHSGYYTVFSYSDDYGETWKQSLAAPLPDMPVTYPDKGFRWVDCGAEPYAEELDEHTMMMLIRNGHDAFYVCYSHDRGESWTEPVPSDFYGHATTPFLLRLSDGRVLCFWNNTKGLPEQNHACQIPPQPGCIADGTWEDVFTNRDAAHAAVSEDGGKTWKGRREFYLNPIRNRSDFRTIGVKYRGGDKSVHQFQAWELPYGKVLVCVGQSAPARRLLIFDPRWLCETDAAEDFRRGLEGVSTHLYLKSLSGSITPKNFGHCAWNRIEGAVMAPDPEDTERECVHISRIKDPRLLTETQGVVWNFPSSGRGEVTAEVKIGQDRLRICLADRWYNACDVLATDCLPYYFELDRNDIGEGYCLLSVRFDTVLPYAEVFADGRLLFRISRHTEVPAGISYVMLQCIAEGSSEGSYLRKLTKKDL